MTFLTMSIKELTKYGIIQRLIRGDTNGTEAAKLLGLSVRQTKRLKAAVLKHGPKALIHGNRGAKSNHSIPDKERAEIVSILNKFYPDFKPGFAAEKLVELHGIDRDPKTIRQIMIDEGLWKPRIKKKKEHRQWRQRRSHYGELVQFDGSYHHWFEDRAPECCLLLAIDDATGIPVHAEFVDDEGVFSVFAFWKRYLALSGKPHSIYLDKFSTYRMTQKTAIENHDLKTQFQRAMDELKIDLISANSPQAKGRVERAFSTLQDRLVKEMRLNSISDKQTANRFLKETFLPDYTKRFSVPPKAKPNFHTPITAKEQVNLKRIFSRQTKRTIQNDFTISFNSQWYQLLPSKGVTVYKKDKITVEERPDGTMTMRLREKEIPHKPIQKRQNKAETTPWVLNLQTVKVGHF